MTQYSLILNYLVFKKSIDHLHSEVGAGMVGELAKPMREAEFLDALKTQLPAPVIRHTKLLNRQVQKVAVCGGSGSFLLEDAIAAGADVFVTADFKYHEFQGADDRIVVADVGGSCCSSCLCGYSCF